MIQKLHDILIYLDYKVWYCLNVQWTNSFLDFIIPFFRNQWTWAPLYLFLLVFMLLNFRYRGLMWCLFFLATFAISDQLSAHLFKELFQRTRPCNNPHLQPFMHIIVPCGAGYSFPSAHAANHFSLAIFSSITLGRLVPRVRWIALSWAFLVAYSQVYVGVHFPLDVFCGGLLGIVAGKFTGKIFLLKFDLSAEPKAKALQ